MLIRTLGADDRPALKALVDACAGEGDETGTMPPYDALCARRFWRPEAPMPDGLWLALGAWVGDEMVGALATRVLPGGIAARQIGLWGKSPHREMGALAALAREALDALFALGVHDFVGSFTPGERRGVGDFANNGKAAYESETANSSSGWMAASASCEGCGEAGSAGCGSVLPELRTSIADARARAGCALAGTAWASIRRIVVEPYDPDWAVEFNRIAARIWSAVARGIRAVEHVGSTSVPGLWAKPIIDIDVVIDDMNDFYAVRLGLQTLGYRHEGNLGIEGREAFKYDALPGLMAHHLYVCPADSAELKRHIAFRDFLKAHPEAVLLYSEAKRTAAWNHSCDILGYMDEKAPCIRSLYRAIGLDGDWET